MKRIKVINEVAYIEILSVSGIRRKIWEKLLRNWIKHMNKYYEERNDPPYWHGEDANTSFLAAAAWKSGGVAIEQFYVKRKKGKSQGHSDLRISFNRQEDFDFVAEAKREEDSQIEKIEGKIRGDLDEAKKELEKLNKECRGKDSVSICFSFPRIKVLKGKKTSINVFQKKFIKRIREAFRKEKNIIVASYFPKFDMEKMRSIEYGDKFVYPGVLLVARIEK